MSSSNPRRMDAPDERFGSTGSPPARVAGDGDHFHHGARRSVSAPERAQCGSFRLSHKTFRRRGSCAARSQSDVVLGAVPRFWRQRGHVYKPPGFSSYIYRQRGGETSRESLLGIQISSAMCLWTSATGIIKLTRNWPALAFGSTLGDGNSLCLRSPRRAPL